MGAALLLLLCAVGCAGCAAPEPASPPPELPAVRLRGAELPAGRRAWLEAECTTRLGEGARWLGVDDLGGNTIEVWVVDDAEVWAQLETAGPRHLGRAFFLPSTAPLGERTLRVVLERSGGDLPVDPGALAHELGHALLAAHRERPGPAWLEEGFAEWLHVRADPARAGLLRARAEGEGPWRPSRLMAQPRLGSANLTGYAQAWVLFERLSEEPGWPALVLTLRDASGAAQRAQLESGGCWPPEWE